jgi:hypothetical protein
MAIVKPSTEENKAARNRDPESFDICAFWKEQIKVYDEVHGDWEKRGETITSRYRDERNKAFEQGQRHLNLLWSTTEIMTPAVYSQCPTPMVERRFLDRDPVGRVSATILERAIRFELEDNGFHEGMQRAVKDYFLPGRGVLWVRYEPEFGMGVSLPVESQLDLSEEEERVLDGDEDAGEDEREEKLEETGEQLLTESAPVDYIYWKDFLFFPAHARTWNEVTAIGKRVYMSKDEIGERWGKDLAEDIKPDTALEQTHRKNVVVPSIMFDRTDRKRVVYEIWNKNKRDVTWISTGYDYVIDTKEDPLQLKGFFPVPKPLFAVTTNDTCVPIPFYIEYQDQAIQIDELTQRIHMLGKCVKVVGTYDASNRALKRLLDESTENELIPVQDWARHREKGGIEGAISFLPIRDVVEALQVLVELRAKIMEDLDRVTGIADILRGTTDARETMGGQRLKQNAANTRLDKLRDDVAIFGRDTIRLVAEVIAKQFSDDTLLKTSGILYEEGLSFDDFDAMRDQLEPAVDAGQGLGQPVQPRPVPPGNQPPLPAQPPAPAGAPPGAGAPPANPVPGGPSGLPQAPGINPVQPAAGMPQPGAPGQASGPPPIIGKLRRIMKAVKLLRDDIPRGYRITIETDSTIAGEVAQERDDAIAFLTAISKFLEQAQLIGAANVEIVPLLGKLLQFGVRKFRTGRDLESAVDDFCDDMIKAAKHRAENPGLQPPSPDQLKAQSEQRKAEAEIQKIQLSAHLDAQNDQRRMQQEQAQAQRDAMAQAAEEQRQGRLAEMKFQFEARLAEMKMQMEERKMAMQEQAEQRKMAMEGQRMQMESAHEQHRMGLERQSREMEHQFGMREMEAKSKENEAARAHQAKQREQGAGNGAAA